MAGQDARRRVDTMTFGLRKEALVKGLVIATIAGASLAAIAAFPATAQQPAPPDLTKVDTQAVSTLTPDKIRVVQQALQGKGIDPGPIDGIVGPRTREAVRNLQDRYGMNPTGEIDNQTLFALGKAELIG
jgi:peptidoglycan hydrolase-like protein with peptidoglycan-binding domain